MLVPGRPCGQRPTQPSSTIAPKSAHKALQSRDRLQAGALASTELEQLVSSFYISEDVNDDGVVVLAAAGEIDLQASPQLNSCISGHLKAGSRQVVLDLSLATFIDSTAIGVMASSAAKLDQEGGSLTLVCPPENDKVVHILEIAGMPALAALHDSRDDALAVLAGNA